MNLTLVILLGLIIALLLMQSTPYAIANSQISIQGDSYYNIMQNTFSYEILNLNEQININKTGACFFQISMTVNYSATTSVLVIPMEFKNIYHLETYLDNDKINSSLKILQRNSVIKVNLPAERSANNQDNLTLLFFTTDLVSKTIEYFDFEYFVTFATSTYLFTLTVRLPEGGKLIDAIRGPSIFPYPTANWTDGTYFYFQWELIDIRQDTQMSFVMKYIISPQESLANNSAETGQPVIGLAQILGLLLGIAVSVLIVYTSFMLFSKRRRGGLELLLSDNERKVVRALLKRGGKCKQFELVLDTKLSKAAVSIALSSLEKKRLITRERYGKLNIIHTTDRLKDFISPEFGNEKEEKTK